MSFENVGGEVHEYVLVRLRGGRTVEDVTALLGRAGRPQDPPRWLEELGGVPLLGAGEEVRLTRELDRGRYAFVCTFPSATGVPHYELGMVREFMISGDSGRTLPEADATITARDDTMDVPELSAGRHVLELVNAASTPRGFDLVTFEPENRDKILPWAAGGYRGRPPARFLGAMHAVPPGTTAYLEVTLIAGETYVFLDDESGIRHEFVPS